MPTQCRVCDGSLALGGPIWNRPLHDMDFVRAMAQYVRDNTDKFKTEKRILAILVAIIDENVLSSYPLNYELSHIAGGLKTTILPKNNQLKAGFVSLGYKLVQTYYNHTLFKTDAPPEVMYDILKAWVIFFSSFVLGKESTL